MFKISDQVEWTSQAGGRSKKKEGRIVRIVPPGFRPHREDFPKLYTASGIGSPRGHESYVIEVPGKTPGSVRYYWPRVAALRLVGREGKG